jgi:hypothetical protein
MRVLITTIGLVFAAAATNVEALQVPVDGAEQATICDGCFVPNTSVKCKDDPLFCFGLELR